MPGGINKGQAAAVNLGLAAASGDVIAVLDSDDYWHPKLVEMLLARLNAADSPDLAYANGTVVDGHGKPLYQMLPSDHAEFNEPSRLLLDCYITTPGQYLAHSSLYLRVGPLDERLRAAQDHDMIVRMAEVGRLAYVAEPLFFYRIHGDSISARGQELRWRNGFVVLAKAIARHPYSTRIVRKRRAVIHYRLGQALRRRGHYLKAALHFVLALAYDPLRALAVVRGAERR